MGDILVSVLGYYLFVTVSHLQGSGTVFYLSSVWGLYVEISLPMKKKCIFERLIRTYFKFSMHKNCFQNLKTYLEFKISAND